MADSRDSMEEPLYRRILAGMTSWLSRVRGSVLAMWNRFRGRPDPTAVYSTTPLWTQVVDGLVPDLLKAARVGWAETTSRPYTGREQFIFDELAKVRNLLTNIPDETAKLISDEISRAVGMGASPDQIAEGVQRILTETGSNYWPARARVIAVTSVHQMANAGSQAAMIMLQARTDKVLLKEWVARKDDRVRHDHEEADGQQTSITGYFMVGGTPMLFPGDPDAPASQTVHCRCSMKLVEA